MVSFCIFLKKSLLKKKLCTVTLYSQNVGTLHLTNTIIDWAAYLCLLLLL